MAGLALSVGLLVLGAWAAARQWRAADGLLSAAVALPAIVYALLTYYLLGASRDQVAALQAQIHEERISRAEEQAAAVRANELAQDTLRESARGRLSAQAPTVVVRLCEVRGEWYKSVTRGERQPVPAPVEHVFEDAWPDLYMDLVMTFEVRNHGPGVALVNVMGLMQQDALWMDDWFEHERRSFVKVLSAGDVTAIAMRITGSAKGWWSQAKEGLRTIGAADNSQPLRWELQTSPPDHSVIDHHVWWPSFRPLDAKDVLFTVRPLQDWVDAPMLWLPTREYPSLP